MEPRYFSVTGTMSLPEKKMGAESVMQQEGLNTGAEKVLNCKYPSFGSLLPSSGKHRQAVSTFPGFI